MIVGHIRHWKQEKAMAHPVIRQALDYLERTNFTDMETGKYPIIPDQMYAMVMQLTTKPLEEAKAEKHEQFLDIHYVLQGSETIGYAVNSGANQTIQPYDADGDYALYGHVEGERFVRMSAGDYVVLLPEDIHRPGLCDNAPGPVRKVVVKISIDLFQ
ncbi:YhcH/YjgK/YiaL family protein [Paenibacillus sp. NPDC056579]|uniref:YhcH/YjgK/YiaL family protein n=1 Tax=Paenibacillus sp. NPDC056579 TaxID=3345871 RepID=UPI00367DFC5B